MTTAPTPTAADLVLEALRALAAADGLWAEADDDAIALAAGVEPAEVPSLLCELEDARRIGVIDGRSGVDGRVVWLCDGPRAKELRRLEWLTRNGLDVEAPPARRPRDISPGGWARYEKLGTWDDLSLPRLEPIFPPGFYTPQSKCDHAVNPIRPGRAVCCVVCHCTGIDGRIERAALVEARRTKIDEDIAEEPVLVAEYAELTSPGLLNPRWKLRGGKGGKGSKARRKAGASA